MTFREVRADFDDTTIVVYQAFRPQTVDAAIAAGTFAGGFKRDRMTWIKPSFLWMMYRCGWGEKEGQERVVRIRLTRAGFDAALSQSCLASYERDLYGTREAWEQAKRTSPVRVQWDPERSIDLTALDHRAIQVGLGPAVVPAYVDEWIVGIEDMTNEVHAIKRSLRRGARDEAMAALPRERAYPLPAAIAARVGASDQDRPASL